MVLASGRPRLCLGAILHGLQRPNLYQFLIANLMKIIENHHFRAPWDMSPDPTPWGGGGGPGTWSTRFDPTPWGGRRTWDLEHIYIYIHNNTGEACNVV